MTALAEPDSLDRIVRANASALLEIARKHSLCDADAADAYQRTLEIYLRRADRVEGAGAAGWLRAVCKHEAMRLCASRHRVVPADPHGWDKQPAADPHEADDRAASLERVARAAEALRACSPDAARMLLMRADGASYSEIGATCGLSYTQVSRTLSDGRRRFLTRFASIESGHECRWHLPTLCAIVAGEATPEDYLRLRPHLRHCMRCRSVLKSMYDSEPALTALAPAFEG